MYKQRRLLFVSIYLSFSVTAADVLKDLGNFPVCAVSIHLVIRYLSEEVLTVNLASLLD